MRVYVYSLNTRVFFVKYTLQKQRRTSSRDGWMIVHWKSTPKFCMSSLNYSFFYAPPPPTPFKTKISKGWIRLYKLCKWRQKLRDKIVSNKTKTIGDKKTFNPMLWISHIDFKFLYDLGCAKWLRDTLQSLSKISPGSAALNLTCSNYVLYDPAWDSETHARLSINVLFMKIVFMTNFQQRNLYTTTC